MTTIPEIEGVVDSMEYMQQLPMTVFVTHLHDNANLSHSDHAFSML